MNIRLLTFSLTILFASGNCLLQASCCSTEGCTTACTEKKPVIIENKSNGIPKITQSVEVINSSNQTINVQQSIDIPEYTKAIINTQLTKLKLPEANAMLHKAILNDSGEGIRQAIRIGAYINLEENGKAPILYAVLLKKQSAIKALINFGANLDVIYSGQTLLQTAIRQCNIKSAILLIKNTPTCSIDKIDSAMNDLMHILMLNNIRQNSLDIESILELIHELITHGYDINKIWNIDVHDLILGLYGDELILQFFLQKGANPNQIINSNGQSFTPLLRAMNSMPSSSQHKNRKQIVEILLNAGANINQKGKISHLVSHTPLSYAMEAGHHDVVELLIERGANL